MSESQRLTFLVFSGLFGLTVGSFLNVCIFRLPRECMSIVRPRSRCPKCLHLIAWYDNLPVASWLLLGGRCRHCRAPISPRYVLVELLTGALFFFAAWRQLYGEGARAPGLHQAVFFFVHAWFLGAMIVCTFVDLDFRILPDEVTLSGFVIALVASLAFPFLHPGGLLTLPFVGDKLPEFLGKAHVGTLAAPMLGIEGGAQQVHWEVTHVGALGASVLGALVGGGAIYAVGVFGKLLFRKEAMGFGDVKYMAMVGGLLGWKGVLLTLVLACLFGSIFGIGKYIVIRRMGYVPFGPFLSAGALSMLFWESWVNRLIQAYLDAVQGLSRILLGGPRH